MSSRPLSLAVENIKNLDGPVRGTRREPFSVIIQLGVMLLLEGFSQVCVREWGTSETHNHILVGCFDGDRVGGRRGRLGISTRQDWVHLD
jgi:hypothetical protein